MIRLFWDYLRRETDLSLEQTRTAALGADLLVSGIHPAAPSVAEALGLPHVTLLFCPQMLRSHNHPPPFVPWLSLPGICNRALWSVFGRGFEMVMREPLDRCRHAWGLPPITDMMNYLVSDRDAARRGGAAAATSYKSCVSVETPSVRSRPALIMRAWRKPVACRPNRDFARVRSTPRAPQRTQSG